MSEPLVATEGLCAGYGDGQVLSDISLTLARGSSPCSAATASANRRSC
jgi:hypothetical protein